MQLISQPARPQRLCSLSSGLPLFSVSEHGVQNGEDLAGGGDQANHFWLTCREQTLIETLQGSIAADRRQGSHVECGAQRRPAAANDALALPTAGLAGEGSKPARLAISRRFRVPSSGTSARSVRASVLPIPGKVTRRSSFSRQAGEPRTSVSISPSISGSSFSSDLMVRVRLFSRPAHSRPVSRADVRPRSSQ